jgi:hypothetical protein
LDVELGAVELRLALVDKLPVFRGGGEPEGAVLGLELDRFERELMSSAKARSRWPARARQQAAL